MITPDQFTPQAIAWIDSMTTILLDISGKCLLLIAAYAGVASKFKQADAELRGKVDALEKTADEHTAQIAANAVLATSTAVQMPSLTVAQAAEPPKVP